MVTTSLQQQFAQACRDGDKKAYDEMIEKYLNSTLISLDSKAVYTHNGDEKIASCPLFCAAASGNMEIVLDLLNRGADVNAQNDKWASPLFIAAFHGHLDIVKELLDRGADVNAPDFDNVSPLHVAAQNGHADVVKELLGAGTDLELESNIRTTDYEKETMRGPTALEAARKSNQTEVVTLIESVVSLRDSVVNSESKEGAHSLLNEAKNLGLLKQVLFATESSPYGNIGAYRSKNEDGTYERQGGGESLFQKLSSEPSDSRGLTPNNLLHECRGPNQAGAADAIIEATRGYLMQEEVERERPRGLPSSSPENPSALSLQNLSLGQSAIAR